MIKTLKDFSAKTVKYVKEHTRSFALITMCVLMVAVSTVFVLCLNVVSINDGSSVKKVYTLQSDVKGILGSAGYNTDDYNIIGSNNDGNNYSIEIAPTFTVHITYGEKTLSVVTSAATVKDIIALSGITLKDGDMVSLPLAQIINEETYIDIVTKKEETNKKPSSNKKPVNATVSTPNITADKTISTLTPNFNLELDENGIPKKYKSAKRVQATAYTYTGRPCATGVYPQPGYIAVNPKVIPYGTKMYIVSADGKYVYGYAIAVDTGGFAKSRPTNVDLFMTTRSACRTFGRRDVIIYFL